MADEKKDTVVGSAMKNGGGAAIGAGMGWVAGGIAAIALAPLTGGLSVLIPPAIAVMGGLAGHKASQSID